MGFFNASFCFSFFFFTHLILSHGFSDYTLIRNTKNSWWALDQVSILHAKKEKPAVLSYDSAANAWRSRNVTGVASAVSNCYMRIGVDEHVCNDILCTPSQAFYLPVNKKWICAYQLKEGDLLLAKDNQTVAVTQLKFVKKSLPVISIDVADTHTFCVGNYGIVTHNMLVPDIAMNTIPIFSAAGLGASVGILSNPVTATIVGGVIACGVVGYIIKSWANNKTVHYELSYDAEKIIMYRNSGGDSFGSESEVPSGIVIGGMPSPEDPEKEKQKSVQDKITFSEKDAKHIFRKRKGHIPIDTSENRKLFLDLVADEKNYLGQCTRNGNHWYGKVLSNGKQLWAAIRDKKIRYAGLNDIPRMFNSETGLSRPFLPKL